jgi:hypothetical protein
MHHGASPTIVVPLSDPADTPVEAGNRSAAYYPMLRDDGVVVWWFYYPNTNYGRFAGTPQDTDDPQTWGFYPEKVL